MHEIQQYSDKYWLGITLIALQSKDAIDTHEDTKQKCANEMRAIVLDW